MAHPIDSMWKVIPGLPSKDIKATASFYSDVLHFTVAETSTKGDGPEPDFCSIFAGDKAVVNLYFTKPSEPNTSPGWVVIAMGKNQLDELYEELVNDQRARIHEEIGNTSWGWRRFTVMDPDDNKLMFFCFLEGGNPGTE